MTIFSMLFGATVVASPANDFGATYLSNAVPPKCLARFLDYPPGPGVLGFPRCLFENPFPKNPDFWLKDLDFSCASPWNDSFGKLRAGTAISKRHIIFAKHFPLDPGTRIAFVGDEGDVSHYSVKSTKGIDKSDIMIGLLDYELTPDVHPAKVLPVDYEKWLPRTSTWPVITLTQNEEAVLTELYYSYSEHWGKWWLSNRKPTHSEWGRFRREIISGDSGNPAFLLYNGKLILLYCLMNGGAGSGPMPHHFRQEIQQAMDELCPGYKLESFDFSSDQ